MYTIEFMVDKFVTMQKEYFEVAKQELTNQKKIRHWMWFMLPQLKGLGESDISFLLWYRRFRRSTTIL